MSTFSLKLHGTHRPYTNIVGRFTRHSKKSFWGIHKPLRPPNIAFILVLAVLISPALFIETTLASSYDTKNVDQLQQAGSLAVPSPNTSVNNTATSTNTAVSDSSRDSNASNNTTTSVTVNGSPVDVPNNGDVTEHVTTANGETDINVSQTSTHASSDSSSVNNSSVNVSVNSKSE